MRTRPPLIAALVVGSMLLGTGGQISYYEEALPNTLNPLFARSMVDRRSQELVFDRLYYRSAVTAEIRSRIIDSAVPGNGGKTLALTPKDGVKWHDGNPLVPDDICFTIDAMLDPGTPSPQSKAYSEIIDGCTVEGGAAVVSFTKVFYNPTARLSFPVLPKHMFQSTAIQPDDEFSVRPVGTGPMKGSKGRREVRFTAVQNGHHDPKIDIASLGEGGDPLVQVRTIINGGVSGLISVAPPLRSEIANTDTVALKSYDLRSWWFIALNTEMPGLSDQRVRQALNLSIDREELRRLTMGYDPDDIQQPSQFISGPFVPSSPFYNRSVRPKARSDLAKARQLMTEAGAVQQGGTWVLDGQPINLKIGMAAPLDLEAKDLLNQIGNQLQSAGFGRQVHKVSSDEWSQKAVTGQLGDYHMLIGKWSFGVVEDVAPLFQTRAGGKGTLNIFNYSNPEVDALLEAHDMATTDTDAQDAYHDLHHKLATELPYLFLWKLDTKSAWRMEVKNNTITPFFYFTEFDGWTL